jgi:hypothetical protein
VPNIVTVGGGTPRRVHSRPKAQIVGRRRAGASLDPLFLRDAVQEAAVTVVQQFAFLPLLDRFDGEAQLLGNLVVRIAVEIRHARVDVEHRVDGAQHVFTRVLFVIDVGLRQHALVAVRAVDADGRAFLDAVQAVDAGLDGNPLQHLGEPARRDRSHLWNGLGGVRKLPCCNVAQ